MKEIDDLIILEPKNTTITLSSYDWKLLLEQLAWAMQVINSNRKIPTVLFEKISSQLYEVNVIVENEKETGKKGVKG